MSHDQRRPIGNKQLKRENWCAASHIQQKSREFVVLVDIYNSGFAVNSVFSFPPIYSADVFVGMRTKKTHPYGMQMLGHFIVKAVVQQLKDDYNINTKGSIVSTGHDVKIFFKSTIFVCVVWPTFIAAHIGVRAALLQTLTKTVDQRLCMHAIQGNSFPTHGILRWSEKP